jgi:hypothetical protein
LIKIINKININIDRIRIEINKNLYFKVNISIKIILKNVYLRGNISNINKVFKINARLVKIKINSIKVVIIKINPIYLIKEKTQYIQIFIKARHSKIRVFIITMKFQ